MILFVPVLVVALLDWIAVARGDRRSEYIFKPLTLVLLIAAAALIDRDAPGRAYGFTLVALTLSLAGDVFLMLDRRWFLYGLASFLLAHVAYIVAFAPVATSAWLGLVTATVVVLGALVLPRIQRALVAAGRDALRTPVALYAVVISLMLVAAYGFALRDDTGAEASVAVASGATLFYVSDGLIGWQRFVQPLAWGPVAIMVAYHFGQIGIVVGLLSERV